MSYTKDEMIVPRKVEDEMKESYLRYSMSVIISRALPDVRDGLKPSQRRILYAMRQLNLTPGAKHRKCAKISGDTSGDYHPHGETVIYPTLVRLAQDWVMRYSLINGQGNFGSIDGDPPAAMRYTEARLTSAAMALMEDLDKDTVEMVPNYDETREEPTVFPAKFPNLLSNGSSGIAVGMATNIPPHNLSELIDATLLVLENRNISIDEIMKVMPGPDFPTGGEICGYRGIKEAYHTGRGKLTLRAKLRVEDIANSRQQIIVDEIPYNVNKSRLIERIAELINEKTITGLSDIRDESDKDGLRVVLELKRGEIADVVINQLYKNSDLQITFGCNMLALDHGLPRTMNIKQFMSAWIDHRIEIIRRRTRYELAKAEARAHILEGYLKALKYLDEVVKIIRASKNRDEARIELMDRFSLTDKQANAVLDLRLYQLTGLESEKIEAEYQELLEKIARYKAILASEALVRDIIKEELESLKKGHKSERKTQIVAAEGEFAMEDLIADEQVVIAVSGDDYIKRMPIDAFREQRRGGSGVIGMEMKKDADILKNIYVASTHDTLLIFTTLGRCYWTKVWQIPEGGRRTKGRPIINLFEDLASEERVAAILRVKNFEEEGAAILLATRQGVVKKTILSAFANPRKKGVYALNIDEGDELMAARMTHPQQQIMLFTRGGMAVRFDESLVRSVGRVARGVRGVSLKNAEDKVVGCEVVTPEDTILVICENGFGKRSKVDDFRQTNRGGVGVRSIITSQRNGKVVGALSVTNQDGVILMSGTGQAVRIPMRDVRVMGRSTQGVRLVNLKEEGDLVVGAQKVETIVEE
ncbi:MAG: DNA gyrase subunit A [Chlamydiae bacterium RIFCSPHIGHO2_12_FULL_44_59]|nr:MAG: DNA gyrase subunit A [Chlamydiae bacterium RIFCSPHIGHO2_01_FULL_44_39]OGN56812.1 MAG: DNA gyrase subunit A [Chlamydiae bacterium RIFCSPHIGHO2_02_FULL_45_9]OGN59919.1 MAG: DNA gyrase subunit A [Chlamydiae bacterium RIFCSPHIGHO2_12_FULL_44_59]OGN66126.1 MAG: DNA gyrase subunit A [Chlamydiae bacterium RIFCSPLOWO2_01_FULL_44_52]OGN68661.1 MAG: DNA gyrase subunit A [Chlamydiae bacterium RIFCSPLOWO2_02_FULL_45_22]OGN69773.1 MAG: DNA gyrase subunit A [Chlamydiae bacterium RIFCSPLOWO2_12_FULL_